MSKVTLIEAYSQLGRDYLALAEAIAESNKATEKAPDVAPTGKKETAKKEAPKKEVAQTKEVPSSDFDEEDEGVQEGLTQEALDAMKYNDLKKLAKERGVDPSGSREVLTARLLESSDESGDEDESDEATEGVEEVKTIQEQVEEATADMSLEEIGEILTSVGISPSGKKQALLAKLVKAVEEGKISLDDDSDEEGSDEEGTDEELEDDYFPEDGMTQERVDAMDEIAKEITASYKKKTLTDKEISEFCSEFFLETEGYDPKMPKGEKVALYTEAQQRLVDDDGDAHDMGDPYVVNEKSACCGHYLEELENGNFFCEICGQEFEGGEEE